MLRDHWKLGAREPRVKPSPHRRELWLDRVMVIRSLLVVAMTAGTAIADPTTTSNALPRAPFLTLQPMPAFVDVPPRPPISLRLEGARAAAEVFENSWRYPDTSPILSIDGGGWMVGNYYRPTSRRSAALHGGSMAATFVGELLLATGSPLAGIGAMVTGATLDAAAADVDRDVESRKR